MQVLKQIKADGHAHRQQKIREAKEEEKQLGDKYYNNESPENLYAVPIRFDRFSRKKH